MWLRLKQFLLNAGRYRNLVLVVADFIAFLFAVWLSLSLRMGGWVAFADYWQLAFLVSFCSVGIFFLGGVYRLILRYFDERGMVRLAFAVLICSLNIALLLFWVRGLSIATPRSVIVIFGLVSLLLTVGGRLLYRLFVNAPDNFSDLLRGRRFRDRAKNVVIFGAGEAGVHVMSSLRRGFEYNPIAFIDDNAEIQGRRISDLPVIGRESFAGLLQREPVHEVLIALPKSSRRERNDVLNWLKPYAVKVQSVPAYEEIAAGRVPIEHIQDVDIGDLLGREPAEANAALLQQNIAGRSVLVTGAGGSIGAELCRNIMTHRPSKLVLMDMSEFNLYQIEHELRQSESVSRVDLVPVLGSVRDAARLSDVLQTFSIETVLHAAAYKHVPMVEHNLAAAIHNNVFGTLQVAELAIRHGVERFILISTDKAVRPTNVMGATKRLAELSLQALAAKQGSYSSEAALPMFFGEPMLGEHKTTFAMVRFGNVLGSSGSVIPLFRKQIKQGGPVTVTHPEITRYFMTIPEAAELVIQAGAMAKGGEVYLLDMGEPVKIAELARNLIELSGLSVRDETNRGGDIEIQYTGLRPGEKLYEELLIEGDQVSPTENDNIYLSLEPSISWADYLSMLGSLSHCVERRDFSGLIAILGKYVSGFSHEGVCHDASWHVTNKE